MYAVNVQGSRAARVFSVGSASVEGMRASMAREAMVASLVYIFLVVVVRMS